MTGVLPLAREFGKMLDTREEIPVAEPIQRRPYYPSRRDVWPPEVWDEMQRILRGEDDGRLPGSSEPVTALAPASQVEPASGLEQSRSSHDARERDDG